MNGPRTTHQYLGIVRPTPRRLPSRSPLADGEATVSSVCLASVLTHTGVRGGQ